MFQQFFAGNRFLFLPLLAMGLFLAVFIGILVRLIAKGRGRGTYDSIASLPLEEDRFTGSTRPRKMERETDR